MTLTCFAGRKTGVYPYSRGWEIRLHGPQLRRWDDLGGCFETGEINE